RRRPGDPLTPGENVSPGRWLARPLRETVRAVRREGRDARELGFCRFPKRITPEGERRQGVTGDPSPRRRNVLTLVFVRLSAAGRWCRILPPWASERPAVHPPAPPSSGPSSWWPRWPSSAG